LLENNIFLKQHFSKTTFFQKTNKIKATIKNKISNNQAIILLIRQTIFGKKILIKIWQKIKLDFLKSQFYKLKKQKF